MLIETMQDMGDWVQTTAIVMAVFQPDETFLVTQLESIAAQTVPPVGLTIVIADGTSFDLARKLCSDVGLPTKFVCPELSLNAPRAFELGLAQALEHWPEATLFAFCDQDDIWHPQRLALGAQALTGHGACLVHSDAEIIDVNETVIHASLWQLERRVARDTARNLLYRNTVTGMTTLFSRDVAQSALPFPTQDGVHFHHDLWVALVATQLGRIARIQAPTVAYRQHGQNVVGAAPKRPRPTAKEVAGAYALSRYLAITLRERFGASVALSGFWSARTMGGHFAYDAVRFALQLRFRLAVHALCYAALTWIRLGMAVWLATKAVTPANIREKLTRIDRRLYGLSPGIEPATAQSNPPKPKVHPTPWWHYFDGRTEAKWTPEFSATNPAINVLVPTLNPSEMFAGIATAVDFAIALAEQGETIRLIATDLPIAAPRASEAFVHARAHGDVVHKRISIHCGVTSQTLPAHQDDQFLATAWWTAHAANTLLKRYEFNAQAFTYLIQDYEPEFYPWGTEHAAALASYALPCQPIFNTTLLAEYFAARGHQFTRSQRISFRPSIDVGRYARLDRPETRRPRIVVYGRPEVARNVFPLTVSGLGHFLEAQNLTKADCDVVSVGLHHQPVLLPGGIVMQSLGKLPWDDYPDFLAASQIGLSLMMSPHPSHPPIEMAAAGMRVVTNRYANKDLNTLAPHLLSANLNAASISKQLGVAWEMPEPTRAQRMINLGPLGSSVQNAAQSVLRPTRKPLSKVA